MFSFSQYVRNFCLAMVIRVDADNLQHRDFINNLIPLGFSCFSEMDEEEYRYTVTAHDANYYDEYIFGEQDIIQKLLEHDLVNKTHYMSTFLNHLCEIANIFASQNDSYKQPIQDFIIYYRKGVDIFTRPGDNTLMNEKSATESTTISQQETKSVVSQLTPTSKQSCTTAQAHPKRTISPRNTVDGQYWLRVIIPMLAMFAFIMGAIISEEWILLLIAIVPFCIMAAGLKAAQRRCPNCGAWNSMATIESKCVGKQKVKVRRNLYSSYYRTSGKNTFSSREVFVSADEYTYREVYQCNICGHQVSGTRKAIDDGIR